MSKEEVTIDLKVDENVAESGESLANTMGNSSITPCRGAPPEKSEVFQNKPSIVVVEIDDAKPLPVATTIRQDSISMHDENEQKLEEPDKKTNRLEVPKPNTCESCGQQLIHNTGKPVISTATTTTFDFDVGYLSSDMQSSTDICRICHCEADGDSEPLIAPCHCKGSLAYIHHSCLQQWIQSSGNKQCELCGFHFVMKSKLKPIKKWEKLSLTRSERRKFCCSLLLHIIAIVCVSWSLYVLVERTTNELENESIQWPFWTKLAIVVVGLIGGLTFMYIQCRGYWDLCNRFLTFNKIVQVQDRPSDITAATSKTAQLEIPIGSIKGVAPSQPKTSNRNNGCI